MPPGLREDVWAIASGDLDAIARVLDGTGKLVGTVEAAHEDQGFIASLLTPDDDPTSLGRDDAMGLLDAVLGNELASTDLDRALSALVAALGPTVRDLIFYPPPRGGLRRRRRAARARGGGRRRGP